MSDIKYKSAKKLARLISIHLSRILPWQVIIPPEEKDDGGEGSVVGDGTLTPPWLESEGGLPEFPIDNKVAAERYTELYGEDSLTEGLINASQNKHKNKYMNKLKKSLKAQLQNKNKNRNTAKAKATIRPMMGGGTSMGTSSDDND